MNFFSKFRQRKPVKSGSAPGHDSKLLIAVMGATGSGKSRFVSLGTGKDVAVGHGLESCTTEIQEFDVDINGKTVTLIDTPGFDDTNRSDTDILRAIAHYLENNYRKHRWLTGIIFLHRITDNRMSGVSNKNILMLQKLVGNSVLDHVICCTTMWDREEEPEGEFARREDELKKIYWANMLAGGAQIARHNNTAQSARSVIIKLANLKPVALVIQRELVDDGKKLSETSAGVEVNKEQALVEARHQTKLKETKADLKQKRAEEKARMARLLEEQRMERERRLQEEEWARTRLEAERLAELRRLEALAAAAERREEEARKTRQRQMANFRVANQRASFGIILNAWYNPSNPLHQQRKISVGGEKQMVENAWGEIVAKHKWSSVPASYSLAKTYNEPSPAELNYIASDIYMYTGDTSFIPAFAQTPGGELYAGFSKIGTTSADMSQRKLEVVWGQNGYWWSLSYKIRLSIRSDQLTAWMEWEDQGQGCIGPKTTINLLAFL